ncbi:MAG TPA: hypothetical protein VF155_04340 [Candidatus Dormibacteraeota bacterium]
MRWCFRRDELVACRHHNDDVASVPVACACHGTAAGGADRCPRNSRTDGAAGATDTRANRIAGAPASGPQGDTVRDPAGWRRRW